MKANKGEWSELYAFFRLLREGRIYAADANANRIENMFFPILKIYREEVENNHMSFETGSKIQIFKNNNLIDEIDSSEMEKAADRLYRGIVERNSSDEGAYEIAGAEALMEKMYITKVKAPSKDKSDISMRIHDVQTGFESDVGFSIKSDLGSLPTLLNPGANTNIEYEILGFDDEKMGKVNSIDKSVSKTYMKDRFHELFALADAVKFSKMVDETFETNLMMIDSMFPEIYGDFILNHYKNLDDGINKCVDLCDLLEKSNPLGIRNPKIFYRYKIKKLLCASALGMTPGKLWNGIDDASGGYIIVKKDGDILCFHLYNRNFFEEYLLRNTKIDRPSASRYDYAYVYKRDGRFYIRLNAQVRFRSISSTSIQATNTQEERLLAYIKEIESSR